MHLDMPSRQARDQAACNLDRGDPTVLVHRFGDASTDRISSGCNRWSFFLWPVSLGSLRLAIYPHRTNLINDYYDHLSGVDTLETMSGSQVINADSSPPKKYTGEGSSLSPLAACLV